MKPAEPLASFLSLLTCYGRFVRTSEDILASMTHMVVHIGGYHKFACYTVKHAFGKINPLEIHLSNASA